LIEIVKIYARIHHFIHDHFSINIPGLGFLLRKIQNDFVFELHGKKMLFNHQIADNYGRLLCNNFNEPETHLFLDKVFANEHINNFHFVDIGANIGEFLLDYSDHKNVLKLTAFEPQPEQNIVLEQSIQLNNFTKTTVIPKPVADGTKEILFNFNSKNSTASGITQDTGIGTALLSTSIDEYFVDFSNQQFVFLIDTEGAELDIMKGGRKLIQNSHPLIIFEYNHVTEKYFSLEEVKAELGPTYSIFQLEQSGELSERFKKIWNLVAIPKNDTFKYLLPKRVN
jgi:FkbM family methyltransferase